MPAAPDVVVDLGQQGVAGDIERRHDEQAVIAKVPLLGKDDVGFHVQLVERGVVLFGDGLVIDLAVKGHEVEGVQGIQTQQDGDLVFFAEIDQLGSGLLQFLGDLGDFSVNPSGLQIVGQDAFPISFLAVVERVPMPVANEIGSSGDVEIDGQAELAGIGRKLAARVPSRRLGRGLGHQVVAALEAAGEIAHHGDKPAVHLVLEAHVDVDRRHVQSDADVIGVDVEGQAGEIMADELVGALELADDPGLPGQEIAGDAALETLPFQLVAGIDDAVPGRDVAPVGDVLTPVVQAPGLGHVLGCLEQTF